MGYCAHVHGCFRACSVSGRDVTAMREEDRDSRAMREEDRHVPADALQKTQG